MVLIAVAGGSSPTLGNSIVTAILATGKHQAIILSRKPEKHDQSPPTEKYGASNSYVSYDSIDSLTAVPQGVQTMLSCLKIVDPGQMEATHLNLIRASIAAGTVRRFSPSDFSLGPLTHEDVDLLANKSTLLKACQNLVASQSSDIEVAHFHNGMFMEYFAQKLPNPMTLRLWASPAWRLFGAPARNITTSIRDIGKFVAASLDIPPVSWTGFTGMAGATVTLAEIRDLLTENTNAPRVRDKTITAKDCEEIEKKYDAQLAKGFNVEALIGKIVAQMEKASCQDTVGECIIEPRLNQLCPEVEVTDLRTYLKEVWGPKQ